MEIYEIYEKIAFIHQKSKRKSIIEKLICYNSNS